MSAELSAAIFDLDGVIVDTAKYHYLAWKRLAQQNGFDFTEKDNERLKGVSRTASLEILFSIGGIALDEEKKERLAALKNEWYVDYIRQMDESELLPGAADYLRKIRAAGIKIALGSASKNAPLILERLHITDLFDAIIDGSQVTHSKPDPEVFLKAAEELSIPARECLVFEDAEAGIEAANRAGMHSVGIGSPAVLKDADLVVPGLQDLLNQDLSTIRELF